MRLSRQIWLEICVVNRVKRDHLWKWYKFREVLWAYLQWDMLWQVATFQFFLSCTLISFVVDAMLQSQHTECHPWLVMSSSNGGSLRRQLFIVYICISKESRFPVCQRVSHDLKLPGWWQFVYSYCLLCHAYLDSEVGPSLIWHNYMYHMDNLRAFGAFIPNTYSNL